MVIISCSYPLRRHHAKESPLLHPWPPSLLPFPGVATKESVNNLYYCLTLQSTTEKQQERIN